MELVWQTQRRKTLVDWPQLVDDRLEILVRAATAAGENVSRAQVLAALVATADTSPEAVAAAIHRYRLLEPADLESDRPDEALLPQVTHRGPRRSPA